MTAALDDELSARRHRAFDRHLATCQRCRGEWAETDRLLVALESLPRETAVPARLEQSTLRQVRMAADPDTGPGWRRWFERLALPKPIAAAAVLLLAVGALWWRAESLRMAPEVAARARGVARSVAPTQVARSRPEVRDEQAEAPAEVREPPADLAAAPELFVDLPILLNLEKLRNFESILTTTVDEGTRAPEEEPPFSG